VRGTHTHISEQEDTMRSSPIHARHARRRGRRVSRRCLLEPLEPRTLFSATLTGPTLVGGLNTVTLTTTGNNTLTINHQGDTGNVFFFSDTTERGPVDQLIVRCGSGVDNITYNLTHANLARNFILDVDLGDGNDSFTANLNTDVNAHRSLSIKCEGSGGMDSETVNADRDNNTDGFRIGGNANCRIDLFGGAFSDFVKMDYQGDLDGEFGGFIFLDRFTDGGTDVAKVNAIIDAGSTGSLAESIEGGLADDTITFGIADHQGGRIARADVDAGFNIFDNDTVNHTSNVHVTNAEHDHIISAPAFLNRTVTPKIEAGAVAKLSGIITEPDAGDTFFLDVDWGDGTKQTLAYPPGSFVSGQTLATVEHVYAHKGKYHIHLTWRDQTGLSNDDNTLVVHVKHGHK
jgi:hypothetical protein